MKSLALTAAAVLLCTSFAFAQETQPEAPATSPALTAAQMGQAFDQGDWVVNAYGSYTFDLFGSDDGELALAHVGAGYFFIDDVSINLEAVVGQVNPDLGASGYSLGLDLLLRWHAWKSADERISFFFEGGSGIVWQENTFPIGGSHQNFTPQAGMGITWNFQENISLLAGARWHHISNANKTGDNRNPGYDGLMIFGGLRFDF